MTKVNPGWLLTDEEIFEADFWKEAGGIPDINTRFQNIAKAQLEKDEARFDKEREQIRKDEKKKLVELIEKRYRRDLPITGQTLYILDSIDMQALKKEVE